VLTRENLHTIFGLKAEVVDPFNDGSVVVVPHPRRASAATGSAVAS
jgi:ferric enterobactin transport ATP-binding protein fepC